MTDAEYRFLRRICRAALRSWRCSRRWSEDEFVSFGWWGWECARRLYDPSKGEWEWFASFKIKAAILDQLKQRRWHPQGGDFEEPCREYPRWQDGLYDLTLELPPRQRQVIYWTYRDGLTLDQIGRVWGVTESAACHALARAKRGVRRRLTGSRPSPCRP